MANAEPMESQYTDQTDWQPNPSEWDSWYYDSQLPASSNVSVFVNGSRDKPLT